MFAAPFGCDWRGRKKSTLFIRREYLNKLFTLKSEIIDRASIAVNRAFSVPFHLFENKEKRTFEVVPGEQNKLEDETPPSPGFMITKVDKH